MFVIEIECYQKKPDLRDPWDMIALILPSFILKTIAME